jgi:hypothetical protein
MTKVGTYLAAGWHAMEKLHTAIWLVGVFGVSTSSLVPFLMSLYAKYNLLFLVAAQTVIWSVVTLLAVGFVGFRSKRNEAPSEKASLSAGIGGAGGSGTILGNGGTVIGGRGGSGGRGGIGGAGGGGLINGDGGLIVGGDGGNAGTDDGRGGRRGQSPQERIGLPTELWKYGQGGLGANHPEYDRRIQLLASIRAEYMIDFPGDVQFIEAGVDFVPINWVNKRLEEMKEVWRVSMGPNGYILPDL